MSCVECEPPGVRHPGVRVVGWVVSRTAGVVILTREPRLRSMGGIHNLVAKPTIPSLRVGGALKMTLWVAGGPSPHRHSSWAWPFCWLGRQARMLVNFFLAPSGVGGPTQICRLPFRRVRVHFRAVRRSLHSGENFRWKYGGFCLWFGAHFWRPFMQKVSTSVLERKMDVVSSCMRTLVTSAPSSWSAGWRQLFGTRKPWISPMVSRSFSGRAHAGPLEPHFWRQLLDVKGDRRHVEEGCMNFDCTFEFSISFMKTFGLTFVTNLEVRLM